MKLCGVYTITNKTNGKVYVGSSKDVSERWKQHQRELIRNVHINKYLQYSWNKYGKEAFVFCLVERCGVSERFVLEQERLDRAKLNKDKYYNLHYKARGGNPGSPFWEKELYEEIKAYWLANSFNKTLSHYDIKVSMLKKLIKSFKQDTDQRPEKLKERPPRKTITTKQEEELTKYWFDHGTINLMRYAKGKYGYGQTTIRKLINKIKLKTSKRPKRHRVSKP